MHRIGELAIAHHIDVQEASRFFGGANELEVFGGQENDEGTCEDSEVA